MALYGMSVEEKLLTLLYTCMACLPWRRNDMCFDLGVIADHNPSVMPIHNYMFS